MTDTSFKLQPGQLTIADLKMLRNESTRIALDSSCYDNIRQSAQTVSDVIAKGKTIYGINTGFGVLANTRIDTKDLEILQHKIVLSHAAGTGELLSDETVRLVLALKINSLARGFSGIRETTINALIDLFNAQIYPCIPSQGSVGASGDLAPLAHLCLPLLGVGHARHNGKMITADEALSMINRTPLVLAPKEGLAMLNGTQVSTSLALQGWFATEKLLHAGLTTGALSVEAAQGSHAPFDARIHAVRGHKGQIEAATILRDLLTGSEICFSHQSCDRVQDPYSLRCQPQVMGACLSHLHYTRDVLVTEANAVSDNPLIFSDTQDIISGGNFHAEPVALAADALAICLAEIGALAERRVALLVDPNFSRLPAFLVKDPGINSGFMIAQVTAAALASENKMLAHPGSVDSLPTSANQEDHVSMATHAARRLLTMADNTTGIIAIELLAACQGIDFRAPLKTSPTLQKVHELVRSKISHYSEDRYFAPDIAAAKNIVTCNELFNP